MSRGKHSTEFEIEVDGETYVWRLHRQPQWSSVIAERRGMGIAVRHLEGKREAMLEFPAGPERKFGASQLQPSQISTALIAKAIASALAAGWEPLSRGKTVNIVVDASGG